MNHSNNDLDHSIFDALVQMLDESNILVKTFRISRDRFKGGDIYNLRLRLIAVIIVDDIGVENAHHDVIVDYKEGGLQSIAK